MVVIFCLCSVHRPDLMLAIKISVLFCFTLFHVHLRLQVSVPLLLQTIAAFVCNIMSNQILGGDGEIE